MDIDKGTPDGSGAAAGDRRIWPAWNGGHGHARLAEYVASPDALDGLRLGIEMVEDDEDLKDPRDRARALYELLREKGLTYHWEKRFTARVTQQVRDPWELLDDGHGTCLDLAATYATMCMASFVDVLLAVLPGHAFVVLTPGRDQERLTDPFELPGFTPDKEEGVLKGSVADLNRAAASGLVVPVNAQWAAKPDRDFEAASSFDPAAEGWEPSTDVLLIDAPMLQARQMVLPLPRTRARAIRRYLPSSGVGFREYAGDRELIAELKRGRSSPVLYGPRGQGKSMIARHLAEEQPAGAAWFLDASEPQALIHSLASAWADEMGETDERLETPDREGNAQAALSRLREADGGWLVVIDNADGDPTKLRKLLPVPEPEKDRRVVVTTTNPEWEAVPGFEWTPLPAVAADDRATLGPELAELVRGRRLMLEAFRALLGATDTSGSEIAGRAPAAGGSEEEEELRGPVAFWEALRESEGFGESWLRLCAFAAHLPPDRQPVSLLSGLTGEEASAPLAALEERGLIVGDEESASIRMHRLFGAAIRRYLEQERPDLRDEVGYEIGIDENALGVLDRYGDFATVSRLDDLLAPIDAEAATVDERLGFAEYGIAGLLERFGQTPRSGKAFERAQRHLAEHPRKVANCLIGRARPINQHKKDEPDLLRQAVGWARSARQMLIETEAQEATAEPREEGANPFRCLAMEGLLTRALSRFPADGETRAEVLRRALTMLEEADEGRRDDPDVTPVEKARSRFNLAGTWLDLAQEETEQAVAHLDRSEEIYGDVLTRRRQLYPVDIHPHVAACEAGLGFVGYYRAILIPASAQQRSGWLREATDHTVAALKQRETLDGSVDSNEARKTSAFLAKVALARLASQEDPEAAPRRAFEEAMRELTSSPS